MTYTGISNKVTEKLGEVVRDQNELELIIDLLKTQKHYTNQKNQQTIKKEFQLLLDQYFPLRDET